MGDNFKDISEILKKCPSGTKMYSPICGECYLYWVVDEVMVNGVKVDGEIVVYDNNGSKYRFYKDGTQHPMGECLLFPSKEDRDWCTFNKKRFKKGDFIHHRDFICIYSGTNKNGAIQCFAFIPWDWDKNTSKGRYDVCPTEKPKIGVGYINNETRFATDNEKNLLLSAIEYNGYEWDSEKLELRKKEPEFNVIAEESDRKGLDESDYSDRLQKFYQDNCKQCGSQRCTGVYDEDWREGCVLYMKEFRSDMKINYVEPKCTMNTEAVLENKNVSPLLYGSIDSKKREILLKRLEELYNNLGIDTEFNTPDFLLSEYTLNCLVTYGNTVNKNIEKGYIKPTIL